MVLDVVVLKVRFDVCLLDWLVLLMRKMRQDGLDGDPL